MYNAFPFICEAWPDLVLLCDLKKVKTPIEESYTKYNTPLWVFFMFFKLYKMVPNREKHLIHIDRFWNSKVSGKSDSALMQLAFLTKKSWLSKYKEFFFDSLLYALKRQTVTISEILQLTFPLDMKYFT